MSNLSGPSQPFRRRFAELAKGQLHSPLPGRVTTAVATSQHRLSEPKALPHRRREPNPRCAAPLRKLMGVEMLSTGSFVPPTIVSNQFLADTLGFDADWIVQRTGIEARRHLAPELATSDMAIEAGKRCLAAANVRAEEVDLLVVATGTPDSVGVSTAGLVQAELGLCAPAMDVVAACSGFIYAMVTASQFIATGTARRALVIGADTMSRIINPRDMRTYPLFGDGAGAILLGPGTPQQGLVSYSIGSDGSGNSLLRRPMGGSRIPVDPALCPLGLQYLYMDGRNVFRWAIEVLNTSIPDVLEHAEMTADDMATIVMHQANLRIIEAVTGDLELPRERIFNNLQNYGNTTNGSVPVALDEAFSRRQPHRGDHLLLSGFGAGLSWGSIIFRC